MQKNIAITLPKPCEANWDDMTPAKGGRHCAMCSKTVIDFTLMSDGQVLDYFKQAKGRNVCGVFMKAQLGRPLKDTRYKPSVFGYALKRVAAVTLLFQAFSLPAMAQQVKNKAHTTQHPQKKQPAAKDATRYIDGTVFNVTTHRPMQGIVVRIMNTDISVISDAKGYFRLLVPAAHTNDVVILKPEAGKYADTASGIPYFEAQYVYLPKTIPHQQITLFGYASKADYEQSKIATFPGKDDIRVMGGSLTTDLVALTPGIYQSKRGGTGDADNNRSAETKYTIDGLDTTRPAPQPHPTFWQRIAKPFRKKKHKQ